MTPQQLKVAADRAKKLLTVDAVKVIGIEAKKHFQGSFERGIEGFTDDKIEKWPDIKEATKKKKRRQNGTLPPVLTDKGHLRDSIVWEADYDQQAAVLSSDLSYAEVHNEGGGPKNMPKRQFMGESKQLEKKIVNKIEKELDKIFGF